MKFEEIYSMVKKRNANARVMITVAEQSSILGMFGLSVGNFIVPNSNNINAFWGHEVKGLECGVNNMINVYL